MALVHNQLIAKRSHEPRGATETRKLNHIHRRKARNYVAEEMSQDFKNKSTDQCFCCKKEIHKLWNCPEFKMMKVKQGCDFVKKHKPSFGCLGKSHSIKDCKVISRGIDGGDRNPNRLLHENRSGTRPIDQESANSYRMSSIKDSLPIARVKLTNSWTGKSLKTCELQETVSTKIHIDKCRQVFQRNVEI